MTRETLDKLAEGAFDLFDEVEKSYSLAVTAARARYDLIYEERLAEFKALKNKNLDPPLGPPGFPEYYVKWVEFFSNRLTDEQKTRSQRLRVEFKKLFTILATSLRNCPVLVEADFREVSILGKIVIAAVAFKKLEYWDSNPIYDDSGNVLFVEPAGQKEELSSIPIARAAFVDALKRVREFIEYLPAPEDLEHEAQHRAGAANTVPAYRPNTAFIMMRIAPDDPGDEDLIDRIENIFAGFGIKAGRIDRIGHDGPITDRIIHEIIQSEFLFADLTGERPSVYYEVGYAHALKKRVMLFRQKGCKIHFDLANYPCPEYKNLKDLDAQLTARLEAHGLVRNRALQDT